MISSLKISNFKCFKEQQLSFKALTLFAGANATGKSTTIQSLLMLRQAYLRGDFSTRRFGLNGDLVSIGQAKDAIHDRGGDIISFGLGYADGSAVNFEFAYEKGNAGRHSLPVVQASTPVGNLFGKQCEYLCAERLGPRLTYPITDYGDEPTGVGVRGEYAFHCLERFGSKPIKIAGLGLGEKGESLALLHQTQLWMRVIAPGLQISTWGMNEADLVRGAYRNRGATSEYLRPSNMGFGVSYLLPIVVAILTASPGSLVIIENPEAHLHPSAQSKIGALLARAAAQEVQVVIETHSDHLLNGVRLAVKRKDLTAEGVALHFFKRDPASGETQLETPVMDRNGRLDPWPDGFFDQAEKDLLELV